MKQITFFLISAFTLLLIPNTNYAQNMSGLEIMTKSDNDQRAENESATLTMQLINSKNRTRERRIEQFIQTDKADNRSSLIKFLSPNDVKGTGFLSIEETGQETSQWLYLPALRRSRRISASDETDNFMGSDFTYEDIQREKLEEYSYNLIGSDNIGGVDCYKIEAMPNTAEKKKSTGYVKREIAVGKKDFVVYQIKYFDKKDTHVKTYKGMDIKKIADANKWRVHKMEMLNHKTNHKTLLILENIAINSSGVDEDIFTKRYLEAGN